MFLLMLCISTGGTMPRIVLGSEPGAIFSRGVARRLVVAAFDAIVHNSPSSRSSAAARRTSIGLESFRASRSDQLHKNNAFQL